MRIQRWMVPMWWNAERRRATDAAWDVRAWESFFFFQGKSIKTVAWFPSLPDHAVAGIDWPVGMWPAVVKPIRHPLAFPGLPSSATVCSRWEVAYMKGMHDRRRAWNTAALPSVFQHVKRGEKTPSLDPEV